MVYINSLITPIMIDYSYHISHFFSSLTMAITTQKVCILGLSEDLKDHIEKISICILGLCMSFFSYDPPASEIVKEFTIFAASSFVCYILSIILKKTLMLCPTWTSRRAITLICDFLFFFGWCFYALLMLQYVIPLKDLGLSTFTTTILYLLSTVVAAPFWCMWLACNLFIYPVSLLFSFIYADCSLDICTTVFYFLF